MLAHSYPNVIEMLLTKVGELWQQAVEWDGNDLEEFKTILGNYCYYLAHATPFYRGSAGILEWSLKSICLYHNIEFDCGSFPPDQKAFSTLLIDDFVDKFKSAHFNKIAQN